MQILMCGSLTEHLARSLSPNTKLRVLDHDRVEERNLANQPYLKHQVGKPKVAALAENVFRISGQRLDGQQKTLTRGNATRWMQDCDLVVDCFDNHEARLALQMACRQSKTPCIHLGLAPDYGEVVWDEHYRVPPDSPGDPCGKPLSRTLALFAIVLFDDIWRAYMQSGTRRNLCFTSGDLKVSCLVLR